MRVATTFEFIVTSSTQTFLTVTDSTGNPNLSMQAVSGGGLTCTVDDDFTLSAGSGGVGDLKLKAPHGVILLDDNISLGGDISNGSGFSIAQNGAIAGATINGSNQATISNWTTAMFALNVVDNDGTLAANSATRLPTQAAVKAYADALIGANDAMVFKGVQDCSANPNYPAADRGHTYRVSVAGKIGGASGTVVEISDMYICLTDSTASGNQATVGASWSVLQANIDGAVTGPAASTSANVATFNGTSGKVIQDSGKVLPTGVILGTTDVQSPTNKTFDNTNQVTLKDTKFTLQDDGDATKIGVFQLSTITTGNTRTVTWPNVSGVMLTDGAVITPAQGGTGVANSGNMTWGGAVTFSGAFTTSIAVTANTSIKIPTTGTIARERVEITWSDTGIGIGGVGASTAMVAETLVSAGTTGGTEQVPTWRGDGSVSRGIDLRCVMPLTYNSGGLTFRVYWSLKTTATTAVTWGVSVRALQNDAIVTPPGNPPTNNDISSGTFNYNTTGYTTGNQNGSGTIDRLRVIELAVPHANLQGLKAGDLFNLRVVRFGATDTNNGDTNLWNVIGFET